jgi:hypothetical protein
MTPWGNGIDFAAIPVKIQNRSRLAEPVDI